MKNNQLLQDWVMSLEYLEQATLVSALRGMDDERGNKITKPVVKMFRYLIGNQESRMVKNKYATDEILDIKEAANLIYEGKEISKHWYEHFVGAIKIIVKKHPNNYVRNYWSKVENEVTRKELNSEYVTEWN